MNSALIFVLFACVTQASLNVKLITGDDDKVQHVNVDWSIDGTIEYSGDVIEYQIWRAEDVSRFSLRGVVHPPLTNFIDAKVTSGHMYKYKARALGSSGLGEYTEAASVDMPDCDGKEIVNAAEAERQARQSKREAMRLQRQQERAAQEEQKRREAEDVEAARQAQAARNKRHEAFAKLQKEHMAKVEQETQSQLAKLAAAHRASEQRRKATATELKKSSPQMVLKQRKNEEARIQRQLRLQKEEQVAKFQKAQKVEQVAKLVRERLQKQKLNDANKPQPAVIQQTDVSSSALPHRESKLRKVINQANLQQNSTGRARAMDDVDEDTRLDKLRKEFESKEHRGSIVSWALPTLSIVFIAVFASQKLGLDAK